jgi:hypothetical protein
VTSSPHRQAFVRLALVGAVVVAGMVPTVSGCGRDAPPPPAGTGSASNGPDRHIAVVVAEGAVTPPTSRIEVANGALVRITITSDVDDSLHVHGYDRMLALAAGVPASLDLRTDRSGLFDVETHSAHLVLFQLEVR